MANKEKKVTDLAGDVSFQLPSSEIAELPLLPDFQKAKPMEPKDVLPSLGLTQSQVDILLGITKNGISVFDTRTNYGTMMASEFQFLMAEKGFEGALEEVTKDWGKEKDFSWVTSTLNEKKKEVKESQEEELKVRGDTKVGRCMRCKSDVISVRNVRLGGGDEPLRTIYRCVTCDAGSHLIHFYTKEEKEKLAGGY